MLKNKLTDCRNLTIECINLCNNEDFNGLQESIDKRQIVMESISEMSYSAVEFKNIYEKLNIQELENRLKISMEQKKNKLKSQMSNAIKSRKAHSAYNRNLTNKTHFLKKKI